MYLKNKKLEELRERIHEQFGVDTKKQKMVDVVKLECYKK